MNDIKPIETHYKGYRFRSRLEARWAVFFDAIGIEWEYEKEGYNLGKMGYYLPDFWLPYPPEKYDSPFPNSGHWLEVKGIEPKKEEIDKLLELSRITNHSGILVVGIPGKHKQLNTHRNGNFHWQDSSIANFLTNAELNCGMIECRFGTKGNIKDAIIQANSARFEFGENG